MRTILIIFLLLLTLHIIVAQRAIDSLGTELKQLIDNSEIPGLGVSIIGERGILYSKGFGLRDVDNNASYDNLTVQSVASVSKTIIAISLMKLVEEGRIDLEEDINTFLPFKIRNPNFPNAKITLHNLVTHSSSIIEFDDADDGSYYIIERNASKNIFPKGYYKYYKRYLKNENIALKDYLESYLSVDGENYNENIFGKYMPGERYAYTNIGASLVAYIIEIITGQSFEEYTENFVFNPLGMQNTSWKHSSSKNQAVKYFHNGSKVPEYTLINFPSGGLLTSSSDMGKFMSEILNGYNGSGKILKPELYKFMLTDQLKIGKSKLASGVFWNINSEGNIGHGGAEIGTTCQLIFSPSLNKAFFIMINMTIYDQIHLEKDYINILKTVSKYAKKMN